MILTVYNSLIRLFSNICVVGVCHILDVKYPLQAPVFEELVAVAVLLRRLWILSDMGCKGQMWVVGQEFKFLSDSGSGTLRSLAPRCAM